ncbi:MAG: restriction endonuclease subunit S [bacterium]|nr:restriction endonuclease subunit S [bacterium]
MRSPYLRYKPSGVEWLGDVPEHWGVKRLGHVASYRTSNVDKKTEDHELPVRLCNYTDVYYQERIRASDSGFMEASASPQEIDRFKLDVGDVVITKDSEDYTDIAVPALVEEAADDFVCGYHLGIIRSDSLTDPTFIFRAMQSVAVNRQLQVSASGVTRYGLPKPAVSQVLIPLPPPDEQRAIAAFLDCETAKVDALVAKKQQLIERLTEYRTALITRTVTRGLPPDAAEAEGFGPTPRLKPSGVEWLGDVPEHWEVIENCRVFRERDERSDNGDGELLTVSHITGVTRRSEKPDVGMFMAESLEDYKRCREGDFVINTMWAWMGAAGTAKEPGLVSPSYNVYVPNQHRLLPRFVDLAYRSPRYVLGMTSESRGIWTSRLRLYPQHFLSLVTAIPPLREQEAIIAHVDAIEERIKRLSETVGTAIERLQEYRTALITAAVTGKIDVRDWKPVETGTNA